MRSRLRFASSAVGVLSVLAGLWVSLLALIYTSALQRPDPNPALDGDPCCAHPDSWGEVAIGGVYFIATAIAAIGLVGGGVILVWSAMGGGVPERVKRSRLLRVGG